MIEIEGRLIETLYLLRFTGVNCWEEGGGRGQSFFRYASNANINLWNDGMGQTIETR